MLLGRRAGGAALAGADESEHELLPLLSAPPLTASAAPPLAVTEPAVILATPSRSAAVNFRTMGERESDMAHGAPGGAPSALRSARRA